MLLKSNQAYGISIGHKTVFSREGAIERYKAFLEVCYNDLSTEGAIVLSNVQNDLVNAGFTWEEIEGIETSYLKEAL